MTAISLFGASSDYCFELKETCLRLGEEYVEIYNFEDSKTSQRADEGLRLSDPDRVIVAPGNPSSRAAAVSNALGFGAKRFVNLIDPTAVVAVSASFGCGSFVNANSTVGSMSKIGCHVNLNRASVVGHHVLLGDFVSIGPGAILCGQSQVGVGSFIAAGAILLPKVKVGTNVIVGAGAVVTRDVPDSTVVIGTPAHSFGKNPDWQGLSRCPTC